MQASLTETYLLSQLLPCDPAVCIPRPPPGEGAEMSKDVAHDKISVRERRLSKEQGWGEDTKHKRGKEVMENKFRTDDRKLQTPEDDSDVLS